MLFFPNAKINIGLNIVSKRTDGYHNLETIFYPIGWKDVLEIIPAKTNTFSSTGIVVEGNENLCQKALRLLQNDFDFSNVNIHLHKNIPTGAGLGGGSSDAAFTLMGLNQLFDLNLSKSELKSYALKLGADCPFFIDNTPSFAEGIGDVLSRVDLNFRGYHLVVVKPDIFISTAQAFAAIKPYKSEVSLSKEILKPIDSWDIKNDFENDLFINFPELSEIKNKFIEQGAIFSSMSGSGSSIYGIFSSKPNIKFYNAQVFYQPL